jgi:hypothetical protein
VTSPRHGSRLVERRLWRGALCCVVAATVGAGCTTARSDLGTSVGSCYLALPTATRAVHGHGHLLGVQQFTVGWLHRHAPALYREVATSQAADKRICVVAFSGRFRAGSVTRARGLSSGQLAVVLSTAAGNHVLGTVIFAKPPLRIGLSPAG